MPTSRRSSVSASSIAAASCSRAAPSASRTASSISSVCGVVGDAAVAAEVLGGVERAVGGAHERARRSPASAPVVATPIETETAAGCSAKRSRTERRRRSATAIAAASPAPRQHERELLAAEPRRHVGLAGALAQQRREDLEHRSPASWPSESLTRLKLSRSQISSETARAPAMRASMPVAEAAAVAQAGERVVLGQVAHAGELVRRLDRAAPPGWRTRAAPAGARASAAAGRPGRRPRSGRGPAVAVVERHDEPVAVPRPRAAAVVRRSGRCRAVKSGSSACASSSS